MDNNSNNTNSSLEQSKTNSSDLLAKENTTQSNAIEIPSITLPKGGGALKGIDEKFEVNPSNGTAGFTIPLPISSGRNGFNPTLSLNYNSGGGNSPFGLGWAIGQQSIQRKTDNRLPRYRDGIQEDIFMFSGAEDLVPFLEEDTITGELKVKEEATTNGYTIKRYRPRVEGGFARIEKVDHMAHGVYWKVTTRDNIATIFGRNPSNRITDPKNPAHIFQWLPEFSYNDKGNWIQYEYKKEDLVGVPNNIYEKNRRSGVAPFTNTYLKRVKYGNQKAYYADSTRPYDPQPPTDTEYFFELVIDYGEHDTLKPTPQDTGRWDYRPDAFSSYRSGFEIRSNRLCKRILMFHHFKKEKQFAGTPEEEDFGESYLVRSLDLEYEPSSINSSGQTEVTYLKSITQKGYIRKPHHGGYSVKSLPPMEFTYQKLNWNKEIRKVSKDNIVNAPVGLTNNYQWVDLYGEGISGILTEQGEGWYYKNNLGDTNEEGDVSFTKAQQVAPKPSFIGLTSGVLSLQDLEANGKKQIVVNSTRVKGYFELTHNNEWENFQPFEQEANINLQDPNTRLIDLNGDGQPELVMTEENVFVWYTADGKRGYKPVEFASKTFDEEQGPAIVFADLEQTIFLADMSGDGLTDIVRIRNGEICYWANMGYGNFSAKITMGNAPLFDHPDSFNLQYLHLADVSGTGATDIIYLGENTFKAFINLSGNSWSEAHEIEPFFPIDQNSKLSVIDLLGTGTSCIVWSSDLPAYIDAPMRYIDLMNGKKPHVLTHYKNNLGKETTLEYKSSTYYYLKDKQGGKPWITKLPFPVQVVSRQIVEEKITDVRFSTKYQYHHGYYDHPEREFRGFGMVEQVDSEYYPEWQRDIATNQLEKDETLYQKPVLTKTWFHTGAYLDRERVLNHFKEEYWYEAYNKQFPYDPIVVYEPELQDARLSEAIKALPADEYREALRACKGMMLRQEVFALDAPENPTNLELQLQMKPFTVATHNCNIQQLQPRNKNNYGVFLVTESEGINIHYERDETDARITHTLNTKIDELGNVLESAAVVYGRDQSKMVDDFKELSDSVTDFSQDVLNDAIQQAQLQRAFENNVQHAQNEQTKTHIIYTQNEFAKYNNGITISDDIDLPETYRLRLPYEVKTYEVTGVLGAGDLFQIEELEDVLNLASEIEYYETPTTGIQKRLIEHVKTRYLKDDLTELDFGIYDALGLPYESYQLAYTQGLVREIYTKQDGAELQVEGEFVSNLMETRGKFSNIEGKLWIRSGITRFKTTETEDVSNVRNRFFSPLAFEDPFGSVTSVIYDIETFSEGERNNNGYYLFIKETQDAIGNKTQIDTFNYRTLSPTRMIDHNVNPSSVLVDELGLVKAMAIEGNGVYVDASSTSVTILQPADQLSGLKEYEEDAERDFISQLFDTATYQSTDTDQLRQLGNALLQRATARFIYDFETYQSTGNQPAVAVAITREEHYTDNPESKIQFGFEYSDGAGNVAMAKMQAEPGLAYYIEDGVRMQKDTGMDLRWIGNGRTVLNNKGNPVKQYEPYFSTNFLYENDSQLVETGVTPIIYYDALGRQTKTELPDGTFIKIVFDSWKQRSFDPNDTVLESEWYHNRIHNLIDTELITQGKDPEKEKQAALKAKAYANTPSSIYLDSLGRPVLSIAHNGQDAIGNHRFYSTFIQLDIEGNAKVIIDARGNPVMQYKYDMLGHRVYQNSMDAGERWMLNNLMGNPAYSWDSKGQIFTTNYDVLQRPIEMFIHTETGDTFLFEKIQYGEEEIDAITKNLRGQVFQHYDSSGRITNIAFDFKGDLLEAQRQLSAVYDVEIIDWSSGSPTNRLETETFTSHTEYDALGRMTRLYNWHRNTNSVTIYEPSYNERGALKAEDHITAAEKTTTGYIAGRKVTAVSGIEYNEKGQRIKMRYGNGTTTKYHYDPQTYRLIQLRTTRTTGGAIPSAPTNLSDPNVLQNLYYTYDPIGNITEIEDDAYEPVFFNYQRVEPKNKYTYDAMYRLIQAEGRENKTFNNASTAVESDPLSVSFPVTDQTLRNYTQLYTYDPTGNILRMRHITNIDTERWTRNYAYATDSNRLLSTWIGSDTTNAIQYRYDNHGSILNYNNTPEEFLPQWDYKDRVHMINLGGGGQAYYQYNTGLERSRKRIEKELGVVEERLYLGGMEVYRRWIGTVLIEEIETHHLFVDDQRVLLVENVLQTDSTNLDTGILDRYQYSNHLGSVGLEVDQEGAIISYEEYHPYGTVSYNATNTTIKATAKRYRYTGMERDAESGLNYHSARYYLPWLGRWLSADPIGIEGGMNIYEYTGANPILKVDNNGLQPSETSRLPTEEENEARLSDPELRESGTPPTLMCVYLFGFGTSCSYTYRDGTIIDPPPPYSSLPSRETRRERATLASFVRAAIHGGPRVLIDTRRGGTIDSGHIGWTEDTVLAFLAIREQQSVTLSRDTYSVSATYSTEIDSGQENTSSVYSPEEQAAISIVYDFSYQVEVAQDQITGIGESISAWSFEDLPSNRVGIEIGILFIRSLISHGISLPDPQSNREDIREWLRTPEIRTLLEDTTRSVIENLSPVEVRSRGSSIGRGIESLTHPDNRDVRPIGISNPIEYLRRNPQRRVPSQLDLP